MLILNKLGIAPEFCGTGLVEAWMAVRLRPARGLDRNAGAELPHSKRSQRYLRKIVTRLLKLVNSYLDALPVAWAQAEEPVR